MAIVYFHYRIMFLTYASSEHKHFICVIWYYNLWELPFECHRSYEFPFVGVEMEPLDYTGVTLVRYHTSYGKYVVT